MKMGGAGIRTSGSLAREQRVCVGKSSCECFSYVNQLIIDVLLSLKVVCMQSCQYLLSLGLKKVTE